VTFPLPAYAYVEEKTMSQTTTDLKNELKKSLALLQELRDEVRVKLHLAAMDVKDEWNKLEPHLADVERAAQEATEASRHAVTEAVGKLKKFRQSL
jgi:imidazoleglycerol phosphate dehydratase HisB